jgi:hypothetical protein
MKRCVRRSFTQGIVSTVAAFPEAEQAAFFFDFIGRLQASE